MTLILSFRSLAVGSSHRLNERTIWVKFYESFLRVHEIQKKCLNLNLRSKFCTLCHSDEQLGDVL